MMISKEMVIGYSFLIEKTFEKLDFIFTNETNNQSQEENLLQVSFLKLMHNMIISNPDFIDRPPTKKSIIFLKIYHNLF